MIYLDSLSLLQIQVGYGNLGMHGSLGYEDKSVSVQGREYPHALSAHAPSRLSFALGGNYQTFRCAVALNSDAPPKKSYAHFFVWADGIEVACAAYVVAGDPPRELCANISGAQTIELIIETSAWEFCHTVWLEPRLEQTPSDLPAPTLVDCLGRAEIELPPPQRPIECCIATVVSVGFETLLNDMLGSLKANGNCQDARLVVFGVEANELCQQITSNYGATFITCHKRARVNATVKSVLYTAAHVIPARKFICLDADMLVLGDLQPIFASIDITPVGSLFACREANGSRFTRLDQAINAVYGGHPLDLKRLLGSQSDEGSYSFVVNDGIFAGGRTALLTLDGLIRSWPQAQHWVDERRDVWWRNQFIFNLALAKLRCGVELDPTYNVQLNSQDVKIQHISGQMQALWQHRTSHVLHFNGRGRHKYPEWRGLFRRPILNS